MMNINILNISTGLSLLFGLYSFYGFINYLEHLKKDIDELYEVSMSVNELNINYKNLHMKYEQLLSEHNDLKNNVTELTNKVILLEHKKIALANCVGKSSLEEVLENVVDENRLICHTPKSTSDKPKINIEIINLFEATREEKDDDEEERDNGDKYKDNGKTKGNNDYNVDSDSSGKPIDIDVDYDIDFDFNVQLKMNYDHGIDIAMLEENDQIIKSRRRGTSISDINWGEVTKKFIFG